MQVTVRPMTEDDYDAAGEVRTRSFQEYDRVFGEPPMEITPALVERQLRRLQHFLTHDAGGAWVGLVDGEVVGVALALRRGGLWGLSLLAVDPARQSGGVGRRLLDASLTYADEAGTAVILSSQDARAIRSYASAGFDLYPQVRATGALDRAVLPAADRRVRAGTADDNEFADAVDVTVRGAPRGPDHAMLGEYAAMYVVDDGPHRGYAYVRPAGQVVTVAATDDDTATALLWQCLAVDTDEPRTIDHITGEQQWAVRVAVAARLRLEPAGPVFWRGRTPPTSYLPDGAFL